MHPDWYYTINGQTAPTPVTLAQLRHLVAAGQIRPADLVWQEGMSAWVPASTVKGLFNRSRKRGRGEGPDVSEPGGLLRLHPLAVLLLTLLTLGLFALFYAFLVCRLYRKQVGLADADGPGRIRHPLGVFLLSYLTLGVYWCYWVYRTMKECSEHTGRRDVNPRLETF